ncbi:MAG: hypothetical protein U5L09_07895 [Bacteroidales bacterium]|nr:hypothetical protein [Bacteroidales bacterium]
MTKYLIIFLFVVTACCKEGNETSKYLLTDFEKESIPYSENESVPFIHSNGFEFDLTVTSRTTVLNKTETQHCGEDYSTYETLLAELSSDTPEFYINFEVVPVTFNPHMTIKINKYYFDLDIVSDPDFDTLTINEKEFGQVYMADSFTTDTTVIRPHRVLYNKEVGIIQISMTNNESYTINQ